MPSASVERIARALLEIAAQEPSSWQGISRRERVAARQAAAVLEALEAAHADGAADDWGRSIGLWETVLPIFERLAGSPRDKEEPNA